MQARVDDLRTQEAQKDAIGTPAEGMDLDPRYQVIAEELKQKWLQEHPGQDFLTEAGQNYNLGYMNSRDANLPTLKTDANKLFRERYPQDAQAYDTKENTRIYERPEVDPQVREYEDNILKRTNFDPQVRNANASSGIDNYGNIWARVHGRESINQWSNFATLYPEKAKAYAEMGHAEIQRALKIKENRELAPGRAQSILAKYPTQEAFDAAVARGDEEAMALDAAYGERVRKGRTEQGVQDALLGSSVEENYQTHLPADKTPPQMSRQFQEGLREQPTNDAIKGIEPTGQPNPEFTEAVRQSFARLERVRKALAELPQADKEALARGAREHAKEEADIEDTADLDPKAVAFNKAYMEFLLGKGWDEKLK